MKFLNYQHIKDFYNIASDSVRSTEAINQNEAFLSVQAVQDHQEIYHSLSSLRIVARLIPTYSSSNLYMTYDIGKKCFEKIPVFLEGQKPLIKIKVQMQNIYEDRGEHNPFLKDIEKQIIAENSILFEGSFPEIEPQRYLRVTSQGMKHPFYTEPIQGTAIPLWYVGGFYDPLSPLEKIESLFAFPYITSQQPYEAKVKLWHFSDIIKKDPLFATGQSQRFLCISEHQKPWNFIQHLEAGGISLKINRQTFTSLHVERFSAPENIIITLKKEENNYEQVL